MKTMWKITIPSEEKERIAITYGDPADALIPTKDYAEHMLPEAITNWHAVAPLLKKDHWYDITAFYSKRKADLTKEESRLLFDYNQKAYDAAKTMGSLVLYFQGVLLEHNKIGASDELQFPFVPNCLSFCIWNTLADAKTGAKIPDHKKAASMAAMWFDGFSIKKFQLMLKETSEKKQLIFRLVPYPASA